MASFVARFFQAGNLRNISKHRFCRFGYEQDLRHTIPEVVFGRLKTSKTLHSQDIKKFFACFREGNLVLFV